MIEVTWEAEDGYHGGRRPHTFTIQDDDIEGLTEQEVKEYIEEMVQQQFNENVSWTYTFEKK